MDDGDRESVRVIRNSGAARLALGVFLREAGVRYAALVDVAAGGVACVEVGDAAQGGHGEAGVLAAGVLEAVRALSVRLGAGRVDGVHATGGGGRILILPAGDDFLLLSVFDASVTPDHVKQCADRLILPLSLTGQESSVPPEAGGGVSPSYGGLPAAGGDIPDVLFHERT